MELAPRLWFVVPAHGRTELARICLRQLWRTCHDLTENGVEASAVVIADDENLDTAKELGFGWIRMANDYTSHKFNVGIYLAFNNHRPVDYVVPCGSDDWVDYRLFLDLPAHDTMVGFQRMAFVREDGRELSVRHLNNQGGSGIRIWPRRLMAATGYWPADPDRRRGCDTSILVNTQQAAPFMRVEHRDIDPLQIVDWKSAGEQLNPYATVAARHRSEFTADPFDVLEGRYPSESLEEMAAHYGMVLA